MNKIFTYAFTKKIFLLGLLALFSIARVFAQAPVISSFSPASGPVGTTVTITGSGFVSATANNIVFFGATMATVKSASTTSLTVTVPAGATYEPISVLNGNTALTGYSAKPFITTFTPNKGSITGGDFAPRVAFNVSRNSSPIAICDLDGDGKSDVVVASDNSISIFRNTSTSGAITASSFAPRVDFATGNQPGSIVIGDLDGDGKPDIVVRYNSVNTMSVLHNTSTIGSITSSSFAPSFDIPGILNSFCLAISDIDGDGRPDLVLTSLTAGIAASVWQNISTVGTLSANSFAPRIDIASPNFRGVLLTVGDIDGDNKPDLVLTDYDLTPFSVDYKRDSVFVLRNTSTIGTFNHANYSFAAPVPFATGKTPYNVAIGDLDGDGKPDLAVPNYYSNTVSVLRNMSNIGSITVNSFAPRVDFATNIGPGRVTISDLDGDSKPDLVIVDTDTLFKSPAGINVASVLRNTSVSGSITTSSFAPRVDFDIGYLSYSLAIADLDGDGKPDIAAFNTNVYSAPGVVSILRNNPIFPPNIQATNVTFSGTAASFTMASWTNGNGSARAVFISETSTGSPLPVNNVTYTANTAFGSGTQIGSSGWYCIYNGTGDTVKITGLRLGSTYRVMALEYNGVAGYEDYLTSTATGNPANVTTRPGSNSVLSNLTISSGILDPGFASAVTSYGTSVSNSTATLIVTPTPFDPDATVTVNGGSPSTPVNLAVGVNNITVKVTSQDGTSTTTYTIEVIRLPIHGQAPNIAYANGNIVITNNSPFSITPTNRGGLVPKTHYGKVIIFAGSETEAAGYINDTGTAAQFNWPQQMVNDAAGNLYVTDAFNHSIRMITPSGVVTTFAGSLTGLSGLSDGQGTAALFNFPDGMTIDSLGSFYVSDYQNNAIRKITPQGAVTTFYSTTNPFGPGGLCIDASGNLIVTAQDASQIIKITPLGVVSVIAGSTQGYANGSASTAQFNTPADVRIDSTGNIYVADFYNNAIRKITPQGVVSTIAGSDVPGNIAGYADGKGTAAVFNNPSGLELAPGGVIYLADIYNNDIRSIMPDSTVSLVAGSSTQATGDSDGTGASATFNLPVYVHVDGTGIGYVSEIGGNRIRKVVLTGYTLKGTLPTGLAFDPTTGVISGTPAVIPFTATTDTVTAFNAFGFSSKTITISYHLPSTIATLSNLVPGQGTLKPVFASSTTNYTVSVPNSAASITLTPTATDSTATIKINGVTVVSGTASGSIPLNVGRNTITTVVTAQDGTTTDTYTVVVTRVPSSDATLTNLMVSQGILTPTFNSGTFAYTDNVPNTTASITVTPTVSDANATITVNGTVVASGTASAAIPLAVGPNTIKTVITAQDGATADTYTIVVTRAASSDATLTNLVVSQGTLTPAFNNGTFAYTDNVPNATASITVTPTVSDANATITVNGTAVVSGTASAAVPLAIGLNTITTMVTAQDGTTIDTYTVIVTRAASSNATLTNLTVSQGTLAPAFNSGTFAYTDNVPNSTTNITVTPTVSDNTATIKVNGATVASGTASASIPLNVGPNTITTVVTAQDGATIDTYTVVVTRAPSSDATVTNLTVSEGTLSPAFNSGTAAYTDTVSNLISSLTVKATTSDQTATITVNGTAVANGSPSGDIPLMAGANTITVIITAQDGTTANTYTITVYRGESMGSIDATNVLTPNGDGKNDFWLIKDIGLYPQNNVTVFDKAGRVVYTKRGYNNDWDGTSYGRPLAEGTYYFVVDLGPNLRKFKGFVSILRN